jgi:hypothetical protein
LRGVVGTRRPLTDANNSPADSLPVNCANDVSDTLRRWPREMSVRVRGLGASPARGGSMLVGGLRATGFGGSIESSD